MTTTRTGNFPIGFRRGWTDWQKDLSALIGFAQRNGFEAIDVGALPAAELKQVLDAGLRIGSADVPQPWPDLASADPAKRKDAAQRAAAYLREAAALPGGSGGGVRNFFIVAIPEDHARPRSENLDFAADGYGQLCAAVADTPARIIVEGWPGVAPHYSSLACTPADYRLLFERVGSPVMGVNFDPSHLIRMGIDAARFAEEFAPRIYHVHGKDTELLGDELYEHGNLQPATIAKSHGFGAHHWRYTIPGQGVVRWGKLLSILASAGYDGIVSIELEDENFNGSTQGEQRGLLASKDFLASA